MISKVKEDKWQAECDAQTLIESETIRSDKNRLSRAKKEVKDIVKQREKEAKIAVKASNKLVKKEIYKK